MERKTPHPPLVPPIGLGSTPDVRSVRWAQPAGDANANGMQLFPGLGSGPSGVASPDAASSGSMSPHVPFPMSSSFDQTETKGVMGVGLGGREEARRPDEREEDLSAIVEDTSSHAKIKKGLRVSAEDEYKAAFAQFDVNGNGKLDLWEIRRVFKWVGITPTEDELHQIAEAAARNSDGELSFEQFVTVLRHMGSDEPENSDEQETIEAFVALGGHRDKTGSVDVDKAKDIIQDFGLTINIDEVLRLFGPEQRGFVDWDAFKLIFSEGIMSDHDTT